MDHLPLTRDEIGLLDRMIDATGQPPPSRTLSDYLIHIARLGGYLARASDPPPGNVVLWRGWCRLMDIKLGALLAASRYG